MANLIKPEWTGLDSAEFRLLLHAHLGGPGQYDGRDTNPNTFYLPLARSSCKIKLTFRNKRIIAAEPGPAFDAAEWERISQQVEGTILSGPFRVGREYSFSTFRVTGFWRGVRSGVQIVPPPDDAPRAPVEIADHPFILEFPLKVSDVPVVTNHRRIREHRRLTLLLNVLLAGHQSVQPSRWGGGFWAMEPLAPISAVKWVQPSFFAQLGPPVADVLTAITAERLQEVEPSAYYANVGYDGQGLRVPSDLDESVCVYLRLPSAERAKFDRAAFWMDMAARQWTISISSSFASLVTAIESLTDRGVTHRTFCEECKREHQHEVPGATQRFRFFLEKYASGLAHKRSRNEMYNFRSGILHGSNVMDIDQDFAFGWDPPGWNERELYNQLWALTSVALRNWLRETS